jgi:hypothetical protein
MVQFWLSVFPIPTLIISKITILCRNFLWTGNTLRNASALVAWKRVCFPKDEGGLALLDIKARNMSFLAKQLWNIHIKANSFWIKWVDHYYLPHSSIWSSNLKATSSPLWKSIWSLKDQLVDECGGISKAISLLHSWQHNSGSFTAHAHDFFRFKGDSVQ